MRRQRGPVEAELELHETALMLAAILPISSQPPIYSLKAIEEKTDSSLMTTLVDRGYTSIGSLRTCDEEVLTPLHVVHGLLTHPVSLAFVLQAAPPEVLTQAGELVAQLWQQLEHQLDPETLNPNNKGATHV